MARNGNTHSGGEDVDKLVMQHFMKVPQKQHGKDMWMGKLFIQKLRRGVEKAKHALNMHQVRLETEAFFDAMDFLEILAQACVEELNVDRGHLQEHMGPRAAGLGSGGRRPQENPGRRDLSGR